MWGKVVLAALLLGLCSCDESKAVVVKQVVLTAATADYDKGKQSMVLLAFPEMNRGCSGVVALNAKVLLTAEHCIHTTMGNTQTLVPTGRVIIDGVDTTYKLICADGSDHVFLAVAQMPPNKRVAALSTKPVKYGQPVYFWGNPRSIPDVLRIGYIQSMDNEGIAFSMSTTHGDSGGPYFDEHGAVIAINLGYSTQVLLTSLAYHFAFTPEQYKTVVDYHE